MKHHEKKMAVLRHLQQESGSITLKELLRRLEGDVKERTLRRWLNELSEEGLLEKRGQKRATKYQVTQKIVVVHKNRRGCFSSESLAAVEYVRKPLYERSPTAYNSEWFDSYQPNSSFYLPENVRNQLREAGTRASNMDPAGTYAHQIFNRLLIDLSYNSSRLEGNTYSLLDTERLVLAGTSAKGKVDAEGVMILNHKEAIRYLVESAPRLKIDQQTICTLHFLLSDGLVEPKYAGKPRDHWVRITGSTYIPYDNPQKLHLQLEQITKKASRITDRFEQSLFLLAHISYLQAFSDANKRTARLSANIPLIIENLVPLSFNDVGRDDYMSAMIAFYELQDVRPIADLFVFSYLRTCKAYDSTVKAVGFDEIRVRYRQQRRAITREVISKELVGSQMMDLIEATSKNEIPPNDQKKFIKDVLEDLEQMDQSRIAGLGITFQQVGSWKAAYQKDNKTK